MVRQSERKAGCQLPDFFFFTVWKCRILIAAGEGNATLLSTSILFSASSIFFLMDHLTKPCLSSPRQSWWQTRVISNRLDILPEQHPLWENHPILGHTPIILYFLQPSVPQCPVLTRSWKSWTPCLQHPFSHPAEAGCGTDGREAGIRWRQEFGCKRLLAAPCPCTLIHTRLSESE